MAVVLVGRRCAPGPTTMGWIMAKMLLDLDRRCRGLDLPLPLPLYRTVAGLVA